MRAALLLFPLSLCSCTLWIIDRLRDNQPEDLCGNGIAQTMIGEECDGQDLQDQTCISLDPRFVSGQLSCTAECTFDVSSCQLPPNCGNGVLTLDEECDDNNFSDNDGCNSLCQLEDGFICGDELPTVCSPICGDGLVVGSELCDDQNADDADGCLSDCNAAPGFECLGAPVVCFLPRCGDDILDPGEACDDGNFRAGDGCGPHCEVEPGFTCNEAIGLCFLPNCGDGLIEEGEQCDDGCGGDGACNAADNNDGCELNCRFICGGDSGADKAFLFQDHCYLGFGSPVPFSEASSLCDSLDAHPVVVTSSEEDSLLTTIAQSFVGQPLSVWLGIIEGAAPGSLNGFMWVTQEALADFQLFSVSPVTTNVEDCGIRVDGVGWKIVPCSQDQATICESESRCGDGIVGNSPGELCDDGNNVSGDGCRADCAGFERCGDGVLDDSAGVIPPEECDDFNVISGDGCNRVCQLE